MTFQPANDMFHDMADGLEEQEPRKGAWPGLEKVRPFLPWIVGALIFIPSLLLFVSVQNNKELQHNDHLEEAARRIEQRISTQVSALYAVRGLYMGSENVTRDEFQSFLQALGIERRAKGALGIGFGLFENKSNWGDASRLIKEHYQRAQRQWPEKENGQRVPVVLLEPATRANMAVIGYDMYSNPMRRQAMELALRTNRAAATRPIQLVQKKLQKDQTGFAIYLPLFEKSDGISGGQRKLKGFIYAPYLAGELLNTVLNEAPAMLLDARVYSDSVSDKNLLYKNTDKLANPSEHVIEVAGRKWILQLDDKNKAVGIAGFSGEILLILGMLFAGASVLLVNIQLKRADVVERLLEQGHHREVEKDLLLREMTHRLKNAIARITSIVRMSAKSPGDKNAFVEGLTDRLHAMGAAQELLVDAKRGAISLEDLLKSELSLIGEFSEDVLVVDGPIVALDHTQGQAIGLIAHELATNAAKYGAFEQDGKLNVWWTVTEDNGSRIAELNWVEENLKSEPNISTQGFGSRLIKMMAKGQLNGDVQYEIKPNELAVKLQFPVASNTDVKLAA